MNRSEKSKLRKKTILEAAEKLFVQKGYEATGMDEICTLSSLSRRTVYSYFDSKQEILYAIMSEHLSSLEKEFEKIIKDNDDFMICWKQIFCAKLSFDRNCPMDVKLMQSTGSKDVQKKMDSEALHEIVVIGQKIEDLLVGVMEQGVAEGIVRDDIHPVFAVSILTGGFDSLFQLVRSKGGYLKERCGMDEKQMLEAGFDQLMASILKVK